LCVCVRVRVRVECMRECADACMRVCMCMRMYNILYYDIVLCVVELNVVIYKKTKRRREFLWICSTHVIKQELRTLRKRSQSLFSRPIFSPPCSFLHIPTNNIYFFRKRCDANKKLNHFVMQFIFVIYCNHDQSDRKTRHETKML